jgi:hypothetical protein
MSSAAAAAGGHQLFVRHAKKDGSSVAILRAIDYGDSCVVEADVYALNGKKGELIQPGPYIFVDAFQATAFVTEAVESLIYLGCEVFAE